MKRTKINLAYFAALAGGIIIGLAFIPFIPVMHGDAGGFLREGLFAQVLTGKIYSPMQFIYMMFSGKYSLGGYAFFGVLFCVVIFFSISMVVFGIILFVKSCRNKRAKDNLLRAEK